MLADNAVYGSGHVYDVRVAEKAELAHPEDSHPMEHVPVTDYTDVKLNELKVESD